MRPRAKHSAEGHPEYVRRHWTITIHTALFRAAFIAFRALFLGPMYAFKKILGYQTFTTTLSPKVYTL